MTEITRYRRVAVAIHWATALLIIGNIILGHVMVGAPVSSKPILVPLHTWIGLTVLLLTGLRIVWRLNHPKPPYPAEYKAWELRLAATVHIAFYVMMIVLPIIGYLILTTNPPVPGRQITFWGLLPIPYVEALQNLDRPTQIDVHDKFVGAHVAGSWMIVAALALHLAGVLKHQLLDRSNILGRMTT